MIDHFAMSAISLVATSSVLAGAAFAQSDFGWTTEHHDVRNTGQSEYDGPADANGQCRYSLYQVNRTESNFRILSTGVTSVTSENVHFFGGTDGVLRIASLGPATLSTWDCVLADLLPAGSSPPFGPYGIVSSATAWAFNYTSAAGTDQYDRIAIYSGDGYVYALNWEVCALGRGGKRALCDYQAQDVPLLPLSATHSKGQGGVPAQARPQGGGRRTPTGRGSVGLGGLGGGPPCLAWSQDMNVSTGTSAARYVAPQGNSSVSGIPPGGLVLVISTAPLVDANGLLYALDADTGDVLWTHAASASYFSPSQNETVTSFPGINGVTPAVDVARGSLLYLAYGPRVVALRPSDGAVMGEYTVPNGADGFVSSPVLTSDSSALFLHSAGGSLWRFTLAGGAGGGTVRITPAWVCSYSQGTDRSTSYECTSAPTTTSAAPFVPHPLRLPVYEWETDAAGRTVRRWVRSRVLPRASFSSGGWQQLMTSEEVQALTEEVTQLYGQRVGEGKGAVPLADMLAALEAEGVPLSGIGAGKGHARLSSTGLPAWLKKELDVVPPLTSTLPYATPALAAGDVYLVLPQFLAPGAGDTGVFVVEPVTGVPLWAFFGAGNFSFGRSRSSPALDKEGDMYVAADIDCAPASGGGSDGSVCVVSNDTIPLLYAFRYTGGGGTYALAWTSNMGDTEAMMIGSASPVVKRANSSQAELIMSSVDGISGYREGLACPTADSTLPCSGHGSCNCYTGKCACAAGWRGGDCSSLIPAPPPAAAGIDDGLTIGLALGSFGGIAALAGLFYGCKVVDVPGRLGLGPTMSHHNPAMSTADFYDIRGLSAGSSLQGAGGGAAGVVTGATERTGLLASGKR